MRTTLGRWATLGFWVSLVSLVHPALGKLPERELPDCEEGKKWDNIEDMGKFWWDSGAEQFASDYIDANGHTNWTQNMYMELFPDANHVDMACVTRDSACDFNQICDEFNKLKKGGLYYLFVSFKNFHNFVNGLGTRLDQSIDTILEGNTFKTDLGFGNDDDGGKEKNEYTIGALGIYAGALTAVAAPVALVGGAIAAPIAALAVGLTGVATVISGALTTANAGKSIKSLSKDEIDGLISPIQQQSWKAIDDLVGGVYGMQGISQDVVPQGMRAGVVKHPAVQLFGEGHWLKDQPTLKLAEGYFEEVSRKMKQGIMWSLAGLFHNATVIIRDDREKNAKSCNGTFNVYEEKTGRCLDLMDLRSNNNLVGFPDNHPLTSMWKNESNTGYAMDKLWTLRNAVECWEANNGAKGNVKPHPVLFTEPVPPPCFFAANVYKGYYKGQYINMDTDWAPQTKFKKGSSWPHCRKKEGNFYTDKACLSG
ncbi:hypothetical protein B0H66DRAFT_617927 [Apodospora peruviana]|uniref:Uncharacterized protein n=1 Tax=Apodospora peruviana TaxID=516989 RepID=A0AAE0IKK3_9PEZI|nr:hypothetical protein B0H66DRAFT_617927 [Apodospora peruviana]